MTHKPTAEAMRQALELIADMPDPGEKRDRSASYYRIHAAMLKQVAARALGRETVSPKAMEKVDRWLRSKEAQASIASAQRLADIALDAKSSPIRNSE